MIIIIIIIISNLGIMHNFSGRLNSKNKIKINYKNRKLCLKIVDNIKKR
jgi:hypothetical protein